MILKERLYTLAVLASMALLVAQGCKKEEDSEDTPKKSNTEYLTSVNWLMTNIEGITPPFDTVDIWNSGFISNCDKDDYWDFKLDGAGRKYEGLQKCEPSDPDYIDFTWRWEDGEKTLVYTTAADTIFYRDVSINDKNLVVRRDDFIFGAGNVTFSRK